MSYELGKLFILHSLFLLMLVTSWDALVERFPFLRENADRPEVAALRDYVQSGGILKIAEGDKLRIVYPTKEIVDQRVAQLRKQRTYYAKELSRLHSIDRELAPVRLAFDPLYIRHSMKMLADRKYRDAFNKLGFTWKHFLDKRTRKIIEQFMDNLDYRKRVLDALDNSPIYKSRAFGSISESAQSTRKDVVNKRMELLRKKIADLDAQITRLSLLKRWM